MDYIPAEDLPGVEDLKDALIELTSGVLADDPPSLCQYAYEFFALKSEQLEREAPVSTMEESVEETYEVEVEEEEEEQHMEEGSESGLGSGDRFSSNMSSALSLNWVSRSTQGSLVFYDKSEIQLRAIETAISACPMLMCLSSDQVEIVVNALMCKPVYKGDVIVRQFSDPDFFYIIEKGIYDVYIANDPEEEHEKVCTYENVGCFGELSLIYNMPRAATVRAATRGVLWVLDARTFKNNAARPIFRKRKYYEELTLTSRILQNFDPYWKMCICDAMRTFRYNPGHVIFKQGAQGDGMYFIRSGQVSCSVFNKNINADVEVAKVSEGDYFGDLALITGQPRACTVTVLRNTITSFLEAKSFHHLLTAVIPQMKERIPMYQKVLKRKVGKTLKAIWNEL